MRRLVTEWHKCHIGGKQVMYSIVLLKLSVLWNLPFFVPYIKAESLNLILKQTPAIWLISFKRNHILNIEKLIAFFGGGGGGGHLRHSVTNRLKFSEGVVFNHVCVATWACRFCRSPYTARVLWGTVSHLQIWCREVLLLRLWAHVETYTLLGLSA